MKEIFADHPGQSAPAEPAGGGGKGMYFSLLKNRTEFHKRRNNTFFKKISVRLNYYNLVIIINIKKQPIK